MDTYFTSQLFNFMSCRIISHSLSYMQLGLKAHQKSLTKKRALLFITSINLCKIFMHEIVS